MSATAIPTHLTDLTATAVPDSVDALDVFIESNDGNVLIFVENSGDPATLTVYTQATVSGYALANEVIEIPTGTFPLGPFPPAVYNDSDGNVQMVADAELSFYALRF